jgi:hypothetical protein
MISNENVLYNILRYTFVLAASPSENVLIHNFYYSAPFYRGSHTYKKGSIATNAFCSEYRQEMMYVASFMDHGKHIAHRAQTGVLVLELKREFVLQQLRQ